MFSECICFWVKGRSFFFFSFSFFFFFPELGTEPRALHLLGKRSTAELNPQPLGRSFCFLSVTLRILLPEGRRESIHPELPVKTGIFYSTF
ncbi:rCG63596, partial [Rattus norvegicus]